MVNLHDKGLDNAMCCFGTKNMNERKLSVLSMSGVSHIDIFFDGDEAGQTAAEQSKRNVREYWTLCSECTFKRYRPGSTYTTTDY